MATAIHSGVPQQPLVHNTTTGNVDLINNTSNIIRELTGYPPADANHVYNMMQYLYAFPHPDPTVTDNTGGTLPTPSFQPIAQTLQGWGDVSPQQLNSMNVIFHHVREQDQRLAFDHIHRELGRSPTVQEFSKFLLTFEGNDVTNSSRKTLGQLYLENKESKKTTIEILQAMCRLKQMLRLLDSQNQALGQRNDQNRREMNNLQSEKRNLEGTICNIQHQKEDLQLEFNSLKRSHDQRLAELEDERKDKQQLQADKEVFNHRFAQLQADQLALQNTITHLSETVTDLENKTKQQSFTITTLETKLQQQRQQYFFIFLAALFFAMVYFQFFS